MVKKASFFAFLIAAAVCGTYAMRNTDDSKDLTLSQMENLEALSSGEGGSVCTGPKSLSGMCGCSNTNPCKDLYGCQ